MECHRVWPTGPDSPDDDSLQAFFQGLEMSAEEYGELFGTDPAETKKPTAEKEALPVLGAAVAMIGARWVMYYATTPTGQRYIGITSNFAARRLSHLSKGLTGIQELNQFGRMNYFSAKALEQKMIELGGGPGVLGNRINSISSRNPLYGQAMNTATSMVNHLKNCGASPPPGIIW